MRKKKDTCPESIFNAKLLSMISIKYESCSIGAMIKNTLHESKKKTDRHVFVIFSLNTTGRIKNLRIFGYRWIL